MKRVLAGILITMVFFLTVIYADDMEEEAPASSLFENYAEDVLVNRCPWKK